MLAEQDGAAKSGDIRTFTQQGEVPGAVHGIPVHHRTLDAVVANNEFLVHTLGGILQYQGLVALLLVELTGGEQIYAGDLEFGGSNRALVFGYAHARQVVGSHLGLLEQRCHKAIALATMLHAFTHRINLRIVGLHGVVDHDTPLAMQASLFSQGDIRAYAHGHDHQIGLHLGTIRKSNSRNTIIAEEFGCLGFHEEPQTALLKRCL